MTMLKTERKVVGVPFRGTTVPTVAEIGMIPLARAGEYELSEKEMQRTRRLIYGINKDGLRRYRTMRNGPILMVWRIE
jgi:hypothetical protein